jgi:CRP-like cAMP-binding protein
MIAIIAGDVARRREGAMTERSDAGRARGSATAGGGSVESDVAPERAELLRALSPEQLARVRPLLRERRVLPHRVLFFEDAEAASLWILRRGEVRLYKASASGRVTTLEVVGPGEIFGALSALEEERYPATAEGVRAGSAWCLPRATLLELLAADPRLGVEVLRIVSTRLHRAHQRLHAFAHDAAPARLARALLDAAHEGEARVTRRALAESAGTTVETAIRVLRRFEREGLLHGAVGLVRVLDAEALRRLAEG